MEWINNRAVLILLICDNIIVVIYVRRSPCSLRDFKYTQADSHIWVIYHQMEKQMKPMWQNPTNYSV